MKQALEKTAPGQKIAVFIGPEGGFDEGEIRQALEMGVCPVSLGSRILRTETAGLAILSVLMMKLEGAFFTYCSASIPFLWRAEGFP